MIKDSKAEELEAKGLYRRAAARWADVMWLVSTDKEREQVAKPTGESGADDGSVKKQPAKKLAKPGRNDPCPCGSGKKFKKCTCEQYKDLRS